MQRVPGTRKEALRGPEGVTFPASSSPTGPSGSRIHEEPSRKPDFAAGFRHISGPGAFTAPLVRDAVLTLPSRVSRHRSYLVAVYGPKYDVAACAVSPRNVTALRGFPRTPHVPGVSWQRRSLPGPPRDARDAPRTAAPPRIARTRHPRRPSAGRPAPEPRAAANRTAPRPPAPARTTTLSEERDRKRRPDAVAPEKANGARRAADYTCSSNSCSPTRTSSPASKPSLRSAAMTPISVSRCSR